MYYLVANVFLLYLVVDTGSRSKTQELNDIANIVARAVLYGAKAEKFYIASHLDDRAVVTRPHTFFYIWMSENLPLYQCLSSSFSSQEFAQTYCNGDECSQEVLFIRALATLLRFGLTVAEESITFTGKSGSKSESGGDGGSGSVGFEKELNKYIRKADASTTSAGFGSPCHGSLPLSLYS